MFKHFKFVGGVKFYCTPEGALAKDAATDEPIPVPETDTEAVEHEETETEKAVSDVTSMLTKAAKDAAEAGDAVVVAALEKATGAVSSLLDTFTEQAAKAAGSFAPAAAEASFDVDDVKSQMVDLKKKKNGDTMSFEIMSKADLDILGKSTSTGDLTGDVIESDRVPEITRDPVRSIFIESISDTTSIESDGFSYIETNSESGAPATTAELAAAPEKDFGFTEVKAPLKKVMVSNKHSVELLSDAPQLVNAIKGWLRADMNIAVDDQLLNGDGTGANVTGIFNRATLLDAAAVGAKRVADANLFDVLRLAMTKIEVAGKGRFRATHVLLNPEDADELDLTKSSDGHYIMPPFVSADGTRVRGALIISNTGVPAGEFLVGDFRLHHVGRKGGVEVEMTNSDGTDFKSDILTVKLRRRIANYVRANDSGAFQTGVIATVKAALVA